MEEQARLGAKGVNGTLIVAPDRIVIRRKRALLVIMSQGLKRTIEKEIAVERVAGISSSSRRPPSSTATSGSPSRENRSLPVAASTPRRTSTRSCSTRSSSRGSRRRSGSSSGTGRASFPTKIGVESDGQRKVPPCTVSPPRHPAREVAYRGLVHPPRHRQGQRQDPRLRARARLRGLGMQHDPLEVQLLALLRGARSRPREGAPLVARLRPCRRLRPARLAYRAVHARQICPVSAPPAGEGGLAG